MENKEISCLGFGGASLTSIPIYSDIKKIIEICFSHNVTHFDTAPLYGKGYSEIIYGRLLKDHRQKVSISSKFGLGHENITGTIPVELLLPLNYIIKKIKNSSGNTKISSENVYKGLTLRAITKEQVEKGFYLSLKRLQTDYLDFYMLHEAVPGYMTDEALSYIFNLKKKGAVHKLGIAANCEAIKGLSTEETDGWDVLQYEGNNPKIKSLIMDRFPDKIHFHHSCLKNTLNPEETVSIPLNEKHGFLLNKCCRENHLGKVIFSTRSPRRLIQNLNSFLKYQILF